MRERREKKEESIEGLLKENQPEQSIEGLLKEQNQPEQSIEGLLREQNQPTKTFDQLFNEPNPMFSTPSSTPSDSLFSMLNQPASIPSTLPPFQSIPQPAPIMQSSFYDYPSFTNNYMYPQPSMQSVNFNSSYMPSLPSMQFGAFNETPFSFSSLPPEPVSEPQSIYELYSDLKSRLKELLDDE